MKFHLLILSLFLAIQSFSQNSVDKLKYDDGKILFDTIINVENTTAEDLFSKVKLLISDIYTSGKAVIDVADGNGGFIVVKGIVTYPLKDILATVQMKMDHTLKFQFKENRMKVTFTDLSVMTVPAEVFFDDSRPPRYNKKLKEQHANGIVSSWENLKSAIVRKLNSTDDDW